MFIEKFLVKNQPKKEEKQEDLLILQQNYDVRTSDTLIEQFLKQNEQASNYVFLR
jgi:hypothetical protein